MAKSKNESFIELTDLFGMLSDQTRLQAVLLLADGPRNVMSLCKELKVSQPIMSHHLGLLRMSRVVLAQRNGKQVIYSLAENAKTAGGKLKIAQGAYSVTVEGF